jgi:hypothetical protein
VIYRQEPDLKSEHGNFGARLLFDKQGMLFVTLGDLASTPLRPYIQQLDSGIGKIVRITTDGRPRPGGTVRRDRPARGPSCTRSASATRSASPSARGPTSCGRSTSARSAATSST